MINPSDIIFVLSNGSYPPTNSDPNKSLGNTPSSVSVGTNLENLFENITTDDASAGRIDYRCFYVFNDSATDDLPSTSIYFDEQLNSPIQLTMGINIINDVQTLNGTINKLLSDASFSIATGVAALNYVQAHAGATQKTIDCIKQIYVSPIDQKL